MARFFGQLQNENLNGNIDLIMPQAIFHGHRQTISDLDDAFQFLDISSDESGPYYSYILL
jgi:hypothetical protein